MSEHNQNKLSAGTESSRQMCVLRVRCNIVGNLFWKNNKIIIFFGPGEKNFEKHVKIALYVSKGKFWA